MWKRIGVVFAGVAALVGVPVAAFAQTTAPTLPDAGTTATTLANSAGSQLANTATTVLPIVIGVLVLFWAINFVLKKTGMKGKAGVH